MPKPPPVVHQSIEVVQIRGEVCLKIGGQPLIRILRRVERPQAEKKSLAGSYSIISAGWLYRQLQSGARRPYPRAYILACECGYDFCWPWSVRISRRGATITWSDARQHCRDWHYPSFHFHRKDYALAMKALKGIRNADVASWRNRRGTQADSTLGEGEPR